MFGIELPDEYKITNNLTPHCLELLLSNLFNNTNPNQIFFRKTSQGYYSGIFLDFINRSDGKIPVLGWYLRTDDNIEISDVWRLGGSNQFNNKKQMLLHLCHEYKINAEPKFLFPSKSFEGINKILFHLRGSFGEFASNLPVLYGIHKEFSEIRIIVDIETPHSISNLVCEQFKNETWISQINIRPKLNFNMAPMSANDRENLWEEYKLDKNSLFYEILGPISHDPNFPVSLDWNPQLAQSNIEFADMFLSRIITDERSLICINIREKPSITGYTWRMKDWYYLINEIRMKLNTNIILIGESRFGSQSHLMSNFDDDLKSNYYLELLLNLPNVHSLLDNSEKGIGFLDVFSVIKRSDLLIGFLSGFMIMSLVSKDSPPICSILPQNEFSTHGLRRSFYVTDYYLQKKGSKIVSIESEKQKIANTIFKMLYPRWKDISNPRWR